MRYAVIENQVVVNIAAASEEFAVSQGWVAAPENVNPGWTFDGQNFAPPAPPTKTPEQIQQEVVEATQARLDAFARTRGYDDIKSASDYAGCSVPKFSAEGTYCRDARAETWAKLYEMLAEVEAGTRPMPSGFADVEPELPALAWPN